MLRHTVEPEISLSIALNMNIGQQNKKRITLNKRNTINTVQQYNRFRGARAQPQQ